MTSPRTTLTARDLASETVAAILAKPGRAALTALGTVLGVGTLVAILGLTTTATGQVSARFDARAATTVTVQDARPAASTDPFPITGAGIARAARLNGVTAAGLLYAPATDDRVTSLRTGRTADSSIPVLAASPGLWHVVQARLHEGRAFDAFTDHVPVVVLGSAAAARLGVTGAGPPTSVEIGGRPFVVAGVLAEVVRKPELMLAAIVPAGVATDLWGPPSPKEEAAVVLATRPGAAIQVAGEVAVALSPTAPRELAVAAPPDPRSLRDGIAADLAVLFYALAGICLVIGTVGIANTTLVAVIERSAEFGLRRALGATGRHVAAHVVAESASLGALGGVIGAALGLVAVIVVALLRNWGPVVDPLLLVWAPLLGLGAGVAAGLYPARRATRIEPTQALRGQ